MLKVLARTSDDLLRLFLQSERIWSEGLGASTQLDCGIAVVTTDFPTCKEANSVFEAAIPAGSNAEQVIREVDSHFAAAGATCLRYVPSSTAPQEETEKLLTYLSKSGWKLESRALLRLSHAPLVRNAPLGIMVIPERAAIRQSRALAQTAFAGKQNPTESVEAYLRHLDDPRVEAFIALVDGVEAGAMRVLSTGELGRIASILPAVQRLDDGTCEALMGRALDYCARAMAREIMTGVEEKEGLIALSKLRRFGFTVYETITWAVRTSSSEPDEKPPIAG